MGAVTAVFEEPMGCDPSQLRIVAVLPDRDEEILCRLVRQRSQDRDDPIDLQTAALVDGFEEGIDVLPGEALEGELAVLQDGAEAEAVAPRYRDRSLLELQETADRRLAKVHQGLYGTLVLRVVGTARIREDLDLVVNVLEHHVASVSESSPGQSPAPALLWARPLSGHGP
jgi:hypothetical protein